MRYTPKFSTQRKVRTSKSLDWAVGLNRQQTQIATKIERYINSIKTNRKFDSFVFEQLFRGKVAYVLKQPNKFPIDLYSVYLKQVEVSNIKRNNPILLVEGQYLQYGRQKQPQKVKLLVEVSNGGKLALIEQDDRKNKLYSPNIVAIGRTILDNFNKIEQKQQVAKKLQKVDKTKLVKIVFAQFGLQDNRIQYISGYMQEVFNDFMRLYKHLLVASRNSKVRINLKKLLTK